MSSRRFIELTNVKEEPGKITKGKEHLIDLPTGDVVNVNFIIASGVSDGPTFLLTANIHGDEITGVVVVHRFLEQLNLNELKGRIICIPSLNPTGLLAGTRYPQFEATDPNRAWPDARPVEKTVENDDNDAYKEFAKRADDRKKTQEIAFQKLADLFIDKIKPDFHIDLHTFSNLSIPFIFADRVLYKDESEKEKATLLFERMWSMLTSTGLTVVMESPAKQYTKSKLHRSTSGFTLNYMRIPSCTIELGPMNAVLPQCRDAALCSLHNILVFNKMIDSEYKPVTQVPVIKTENRHRYMQYPQATATGIVDIIKESGEKISKGDVLATIRNLDGTIIGDIKSEIDGYALCWDNGIAKYNGQYLGIVMVDDLNTPTVVSWSDVKE